MASITFLHGSFDTYRIRLARRWFRLADGRILLVYNDDGAVRNPLSIAISDDGTTFRKLRDVENESGQDFSYPSLVQAQDGTFYLSYTWHYRSAIKCAHFDANWLGLNPVSVGQ